MTYKPGDIYDISFAYDDDPNQSKVRPALIFDVKSDGSVVLKVMKITSKNNSKYYDQFKVPVIHWQRAGLDQPSWVQTFGALVLTPAQFLSIQKRHRGVLHPDDFAEVLAKYAEMLQRTGSES